MTWKIFGLALLLAACTDGTQFDREAPQQPPFPKDTPATVNPALTDTTRAVLPVKDTAGLVPQSFTTIPPAVNGCSGLYALHADSLGRGTFLLASNLQGTAFIQLNGNMIRLDRQPGHSEKREVYRNGDTEVELLRGARRQVGEELQRVPATLILRKGGKEHRVELIGEEGC